MPVRVVKSGSIADQLRRSSQAVDNRSSFLQQQSRRQRHGSVEDAGEDTATSRSNQTLDPDSEARLHQSSSELNLSDDDMTKKGVFRDRYNKAQRSASELRLDIAVPAPKQQREVDEEYLASRPAPETAKQRAALFFQTCCPGKGFRYLMIAISGLALVITVTFLVLYFGYFSGPPTVELAGITAPDMSMANTTQIYVGSKIVTQLFVNLLLPNPNKLNVIVNRLSLRSFYPLQQNVSFGTLNLPSFEIEASAQKNTTFQMRLEMDLKSTPSLALYLNDVCGNSSNNTKQRFSIGLDYEGGYQFSVAYLRLTKGQVIYEMDCPFRQQRVDVFPAGSEKSQQIPGSALDWTMITNSTATALTKSTVNSVSAKNPTAASAPSLSDPVTTG